MILNYKGKMIDEVNRTEGDLQTTEDDLQTTEDDQGMIEDDHNFHLQTNKAILNPFECYEMMGTISIKIISERLNGFRLSLLI